MRDFSSAGLQLPPFDDEPAFLRKITLRPGETHLDLCVRRYEAMLANGYDPTTGLRDPNWVAPSAPPKVRKPPRNAWRPCDDALVLAADTLDQRMAVARALKRSGVAVYERYNMLRKRAHSANEPERA